MQLPQSWTPCSALRGITKSSGLFDIDFSGKTATTNDEFKTINTFDLLSSIDNGQDSSLNTIQDVENMISNFVDLDDDSMFNEKFMDLSNFLFSDNEMPKVESEEISIKVPQSDIKSMKRKVSSVSINPDHNDYTCKRLRLPSTDDELPETSTDHKGRKYIARRQKNNVASKRSRETRKQKYVDMEQKSLELEKENKELEIKVKEMELLTKKMKDILVKRLSGGKQT